MLKNALGTHSNVSCVQGGRRKAKREIRIATLFKDAPADFLRMIVVHELAHLKEREHDKAFCALQAHGAGLSPVGVGSAVVVDDAGHGGDIIMKFDWHGGAIGRATKVDGDYRNTQNVRRFLTRECGEGFRFDRSFMAWIKDGTPKTMGEVADEWRRLQAREADDLG